mgnify:CR=1 FL=1
MYDDISYLSRDFIFFEFGVTVYDLLGERRIDCIFPSIGEYTEYKNAKDIFLSMKYIQEGYSGKIFGNDLVIKSDVSTLVVGANNTGKTVFLRTIGINQIFAQSGLFVPADFAQIEIKEDLATIFSGEEKDTDVGGRFEKEVIDIKEIIDIVNSKSLVIINEIFQSTFARDGQNALFDILNYFTEINVSWICVTHLTGILDDRCNFVKEVKCLETMGEKVSEEFFNIGLVNSIPSISNLSKFGLFSSRLLKKGLKHLDNISVRELSLKKCVNKCTNKPCDVVLDPTFLLSKEQYEKSLNDMTEKNFKKTLQEKCNCDKIL